MLVLLAALLTVLSMAGSARAKPVQYFAQIPIVGGIPPWGSHTGAPIAGAAGSYARCHGDINLDANTVSGILCQVDRVRDQPDRLIVMTVKPHLVYHSRDAVKWGVPGASPASIAAYAGPRLRPGLGRQRIADGDL